MKTHYLPIIGLEIHVELKTFSKMFCGCSANHFGKKPNTQVCPVCLGLPGALPVPNRKAVEWTVMTGLALGSTIPSFSKFDRKNYFYPDLPKGYQISQYDKPLCIGGILERIRIRRIHLEEDTAKMIHQRNQTLIDFNRSGVPLMEIVTEPDIHSGEEAKNFLKKLTQIIRYLGISDCDMEKGTMRIEPNVSVQGLRVGTLDEEKNRKLPNYKVELKNINSFRFVQKAIEYEIKRQINLLEEGKKPVQETRGWDEKRQITYSQREKEEAEDYRYFPEPDIPPIKWQEDLILQLKSKIPELPDVKKERFINYYKLNGYQAQILIEKRMIADYFEEAVKAGKGKITPVEIANIIINKKTDISKINPKQLVLSLIKRKRGVKIEGKNLEKIVEEVLKENQRAVEDYKNGKVNAIQFLIGQIMAKSKGQADPKQAEEEIKNKLRS